MNEFDNRSKRWIRFTVDMFDHPALKSKEFDRCSAFAWLIANAAWKDHKVRMGNRMVEIKRGQVIVGLEHLSKEWGWGVKKVRLFLELLMSEGMLEKGTSKGRFANIATICNYETYQTPQDQQGQVEGQVQDKLRAGSGQHSTKDTNIPNINNYTSHLESARERSDGPREGEEAMGHGVFVNCETIRHRDFTISLPALQLATLAANKSPDELKNVATAHALQWAAEIEQGKHPRTVVPDKIANFLAVTVMKSHNMSISQRQPQQSKGANRSMSQLEAMQIVLGEEKTQ